MDLSSIYREHGGPALAVALRILGDVAEAEDVVQETFFEVWRSVRTFRSERGSERAWISTIARNRALDRLRTRERRLRALGHAQHELELRGRAANDAGAEERGAIERGLAALTAPQRLVVELAYFRGLCHREIAEQTGTPLGTVKTRLRMAIERLARDLLGARTEDRAAE